MTNHRNHLSRPSRRATDATHQSGAAFASDTALEQDEVAEVLKRRAQRLASKDEPRKAAIALRELTARTDSAAHWVLLGDMLRRARRHDEALAAFREALWRHRRAGADGRARTVATLVLALDPDDAQARRTMSARAANRAA